MNGLIYHAFDMSNGKCYVGQTGRTLEQRIKGHLEKRVNYPFSNALHKRPEVIEKIQKSRKITNSLPENKEKISKVRKEVANRPELKLQVGERIKRLWEDPNYREKTVEGQKLINSLPETKERRRKGWEKRRVRKLNSRIEMINILKMFIEKMKG
jgi:hypothetical protein